MTSSIREWVKAEDARVANDANDAGAIVEAAQRPTMRFVAVKTSEDLAALKAQIAEVRDGLKGNPKLEVVP